MGLIDGNQVVDGFDMLDASGDGGQVALMVL